MTKDDVSITYENNIFYCTKDDIKWISIDGENWYGEERRIRELEKENAEFKKKEGLLKLLRDGGQLLAAIDEYERDKNKQGLFIQLDHETRRTLANIYIPEVEQEILEILKSRYTRYMQIWNQELKDILGEITDERH